MTLILASTSPRRRELLTRLGTEFIVVPTGVEERAPCLGELPEHYAAELARQKARAVSTHRSDALVIAADTVVAVDRCLLGKLRDEAEARLMLDQLRGRRHVVTTGVTVVYRGVELNGFVTTSVYMRD